ncbi:hypothetical protein [Streptomyces sp. NPDC005408]
MATHDDVQGAHQSYRLKGDGVHQAMLGIARLHNLALTGRLSPHT